MKLCRLGIYRLLAFWEDGNKYGFGYLTIFKMVVQNKRSDSSLYHQYCVWPWDREQGTTAKQKKQKKGMDTTFSAIRIHPCVTWKDEAKEATCCHLIV